MSHDHAHEPPVCRHFHRAIEIIGRRWTGAILFALSQGPHRFSEIRHAIPEVSDRLLVERLRELEDEGILVREAAADRSNHVSYRLTPKGEALRPVLQAVGEWAKSWSHEEDGDGPDAHAPKHPIEAN